MSSRAAWTGTLLLTALSLQNASAQIVTYEGSVMPESDVAPWSRIIQGPAAQRWSNGTCFFQLISPAEFDGYTRLIGNFTGAGSFFVTWREMTDIPRSYLSTIPNGLAMGTSMNSDFFHFTVLRDQVQFVRDNPLGLEFYIDVQPGVMHTYYLELRSDLSYKWYIDSVMTNSGHYPDPYPVIDANMVWSTRCFSSMPSQNAQWDYVRYGVIPADHSGDFDSNGVVDSNDLYFFLDCLLGPDYDASGPGCRWADMNGDGKADGRDVQLFVRAMIGE